MELNLRDVKTVVKDMISRNAKFGSYSASQEKLRQTYKTEKDNFGTVELYYDKNGELIATCDRNIAEITDFSGLCTCSYYVGKYSDKFHSIEFRVGSLFCSLEDTNHNGKVDIKDKIKISESESKTKIEKQISEFLG